jgi:hypothetical protein
LSAGVNIDFIDRLKNILNLLLRLSHLDSVSRQI